MGLPVVVGLPLAWGCSWLWGCQWRGAAGSRGQEGTGAGARTGHGARRGRVPGRPQAPHCPIRRRAGPPGQGCQRGLRPLDDSGCAPGHRGPGTGEGLSPPAQPITPCPHTSASSPPPPTMEEDVTPHRSRLPTLGSPRRIPGPSSRRDGPLGIPTTPTKRSCFSVTLCRAAGGPPWERLRGPAPITPVPPRPRPAAAEGPQRHDGPGWAEAASAAKMGVPCSPPRSGGSLLPGWAGKRGGRHQGVPRQWRHHGTRCGGGPSGAAGGHGGGWGLPTPGAISPWPTPGMQVDEGRREVSSWGGEPGTWWGNGRLRAPCQELLWVLGGLSVCLSVCPDVLLDHSA